MSEEENKAQVPESESQLDQNTTGDAAVDAQGQIITRVPVSSMDKESSVSSNITAQTVITADNVDKTKEDDEEDDDEIILADLPDNVD